MITCDVLSFELIRYNNHASQLPTTYKTRWPLFQSSQTPMVFCRRVDSGMSWFCVQKYTIVEDKLWKWNKFTNIRYRWPRSSKIMPIYVAFLRAQTFRIITQSNYYKYGTSEKERTRPTLNVDVIYFHLHCSRNSNCLLSSVLQTTFIVNIWNTYRTWKERVEYDKLRQFETPRSDADAPEKRETNSFT